MLYTILNLLKANSIDNNGCKTIMKEYYKEKNQCIIWIGDEFVLQAMQLWDSFVDSFCQWKCIWNARHSGDSNDPAGIQTI